ncbi:ubiquitin-like-conjugating enzyme ATG10 isoform X2 [Cephus cinctus]|uniref:Ubiquitin-like-conjugating enzyme ATG10 n=1 Tax=Cephus cinctus TaxID=211228 RepID=A0AAJ7C3D4_CEPCN|nr:ubiquitin-like-conjugating enzyme ATG10 isoform X2 [Cephus cinctus]
MNSSELSNDMDGPGTVTWEEFVKDAKDLVRRSTEISDNWEFQGDKAEPGQAYLVRHAKLFIPQDHPLRDDDETTEIDKRDELLTTLREDPFEAPGETESPLIMEHHILWSISYSVPVLFFNAWKSDFPGINPITVEMARKLVSHEELNYSELSQAIHPILGTPFLQLHPCMTQELLQITAKSKNKLVSWLSFVGPAALNLHLPLEYYELTFIEDRKMADVIYKSDEDHTENLDTAICNTSEKCQ